MGAHRRRQHCANFRLKHYTSGKPRNVAVCVLAKKLAYGRGNNLMGHMAKDR